MIPNPADDSLSGIAPMTAPQGMVLKWAVDIQLRQSSITIVKSFAFDIFTRLENVSLSFTVVRHQ